MADQQPPSPHPDPSASSGQAPLPKGEGEGSGQPSEEAKPAGPPRPPPTSGQPPMTLTRQRPGTGRGPAPSGAPSAGGPSRPTPPPRPTPEAQTEREGAEEQLAAEMAEPAVETEASARPPGEPTPPTRPTEAPAAQPARPPAAAAGERPTPPPARPAAAGGPPRPAPATAAPARAAAPAAAPARAAAPAAAAARPAQADTAERLAAAVKKEPSAVGGPQAEKLVYVWPHLVTIEFLSALLMLLSMIVLSWVVNAPLEAHANPDRTPNPSKAPWYFLNLQELLLHMHPGLAGVLVPAGALAAIAAIPYIDRDTTDVGKWFGTPSAIPITIFVTVYATVVEVALVFFDEYIGVKPLMTQVADATGIAYLKEVTPFGVALFSMPNVIVPTLLMLGPIVPMMLIIRLMYKPNIREVMIALFTGFVVSYVILTVFGTFFRGQGMHLFWPWDPGMVRID
jgi:menaquinol-cytochrome c reductase cytochrome b/c subunit